MLPGNHFGTRVVGNHLLGGGLGWRISAYATENNGTFGWSHVPIMGAVVERNVIEEPLRAARHGVREYSGCTGALSRSARPCGPRGRVQRRAEGCRPHIGLPPRKARTAIGARLSRMHRARGDDRTEARLPQSPAVALDSITSDAADVVAVPGTMKTGEAWSSLNDPNDPRGARPMPGRGRIALVLRVLQLCGPTGHQRRLSALGSEFAIAIRTGWLGSAFMMVYAWTGPSPATCRPGLPPLSDRLRPGILESISAPRPAWPGASTSSLCSARPRGSANLSIFRRRCRSWRITTGRRPVRGR